ncbi:ornithine cyclodeaminase family protein [Streptomyces sp. CHA1]|uniref:ornithine cyclodeaminase family protein n=1 Tax=Streptomyces TaxID=1883 RepID=UPI0003C2C1C1|nr:MULTISPECIES: ornithine cyclodeaminase family protein [unclassified Streptomyces]QOZ98637.1 ornithine cyclodeaminase family protein [Streptomyces violascens]WSB23255.1 ornithine cyclodeaminase family protein [Streptomyces albidoflavus]ESQ06513.1 ornithine cyclodeaminase [Streptomyces sp. PVA_94-07]MBP3076701.1 ornithine cyclodeaminase [Streptomyces sp. 604F]MBT3159177.1 ornithine cyclodeaminase family protein [Streptomyces sp. G11C]
MTLLLTRNDLETLLDPADCLAALREAFRTAGASPVPGQRVVTGLPFPGTGTALLPGLLPGVEAYTVKVNAKFPGARPALRGVVCLFSGVDGALLALLDSATVTAWRTGLAAALGTHLLASPGPPQGAAVGVIGAGAQADLMVRGLRALRPCGPLLVHDLDPERAAAFAARHGGRAVTSPQAVAAGAGIVLLATWSRTPLLHLADTHPGQHLTTLGADEPGKRELAADLLDAALVVVDDRELAATTGTLASPGLPATAAPTLTELLTAAHPGRTGSDTRTVYAPAGLPWQDLALSWLAHERARELGVGQDFDFLG